MKSGNESSFAGELSIYAGNEREARVIKKNQKKKKIRNMYLLLFFMVQ